ncbi:DNA polymerase I [Sphingomonas phage Carli]|nr:DNA polymerase I [Sphingomonas phage Carli]
MLIKRRRLHIDYETASDLDLSDVGAWLYSIHPSTRVLMVSWSWDYGPILQWDAGSGLPFPQEVLDGLEDDEVEKWAFNAAFERLISWNTLKRRGRYGAWFCAMVLAYSQSFMGGLDAVLQQTMAPAELRKDKEGDKLIRIFCGPQKPTKKNPWVWRDWFTDPEEWDRFKAYNVQDVRAERDGVYKRLIKFPMGPGEWGLYHLDQLINDRGIPINREFVTNAITMCDRRKGELLEEMISLTGLVNPGSPTQMGDWLRERGYPFPDLRKETIEKVLRENEDFASGKSPLPAYVVRKNDGGLVRGPTTYDGGGFLHPDATAAMKMRQNHARTSVKKYDAMLQRIGEDDLFRHAFQFAGAARTNRWAGRGVQVHNLTRTPKYLEPEDAYESRLEDVTEIIRQGDYEMLRLYVEEPLDALAGTVRSAIQPHEDDEELCVADLSSIENVSLGFLAESENILNVFREGRDPYKSFAMKWYGVPYADVTKKQRTNSKPAVLGAGYRLGGGDLMNGKKTGLWGYAENMKVFMTKEEAHSSINAWRADNNEVVQYWYALENAIERTVRTGQETVVGPVRFAYLKPYLVCWLPSGRPMFYYMPEIHMETRYSQRTGNSYEKAVISYMGKDQVTNQWVRIYSHGGKFTENIVQAFARDVLALGLRRCHKAGFNLVLHVHDEIAALQKRGENRLTPAYMIELMTAPISWAPKLPLNAAGGTMRFYRKD